MPSGSHRTRNPGFSRHGGLPAVERFDSFEQEAERITAVFNKLHSERGQQWSEMCVLYCHNWMGKALAEAMGAASIPFTWLKDSAAKRQFDVTEDSVKLVTMHSSKGLEFSTVATCGVGSLGIDTDRLQYDAKLLYVAMTRATQNLLITSSRESPFVVRLREMIEKHRAASAA